MLVKSRWIPVVMAIICIAGYGRAFAATAEPAATAAPAAKPSIERIIPAAPVVGEKLHIVGSNFEKDPKPTILFKYKSAGGEKIFKVPVDSATETVLEYTLPQDFAANEVTISVFNPSSKLTSDEVPAKIGNNKIKVDFRVGYQTSTYDKSDSGGTADGENEKLFHDNELFYEFAAQMRVCRYFALEPRLSLGRRLVKGEDAQSTTGTPLPEIVKNAESAQGELALHIDIGKGLYVRPAFDFLATTDNEIKDDFYFEQTVALGYEPLLGGMNRFAGSKLEVGYMRSDALDGQDRFISLLHLTYDVEGLAPVPFIDVKINAGDGPDDLSVLYGVSLGIDKLFAPIQTLFLGKKEEQK